MTESLPTAERLLDVAHILILDGGYKAFSYADLAERVGIRKASIHHHFPTKAGLVLALLSRYRRRFHENMAEQLPYLPDLASRLSAFAQYWSQCIESTREPICLAVILAPELPSLPDEIAAVVTSHFRELTEMLAGEFSSVSAGSSEARMRAETFVALLHGAMISARATRQPTVFAAIMQAWLNDTGLQNSGLQSHPTTRQTQDKTP